MAKGSQKQQQPFFAIFLSDFVEFTVSDIQKTKKTSHVVYPSGKPMIPHLLRSQGIGVNYYSLTLDALHLQHPRLLQR
jgi:hypothetical protein